MANGIRIGVGGVARKVTDAYIGVNDIARTITKGYIGVNNVAKLFYESYTPLPDQEIVFTSSQSWTVPAGCQTIDIFVVGGGGGAGGSYHNCNNILQNNATYKDARLFGASGGSGYTTTVTNVSVTPGESLTVVVGAGGTGGKGYQKVGSSQSGDVQSNSAITSGSAGGQSYIARGSTKLATANGGTGGTRVVSSTSEFYINGVAGVSGGNGSGAAGGRYEQITIDSTGSGTHLDHYFVEHTDYPDYTNPYSMNEHGIHGTEGGNGGTVDRWTANSSASGETIRRNSANVYAGGTGQSRNTRKFGKSNGTVYATVATTVSANTGNSGDGDSFSSYTQKNGSSGVVIVICHFQ